MFPEFGPDWKCKIVLPQNLLETDRLNVFSVVVQSPDGEQQKAGLPYKHYLQVVAASNMKQRTRKMLEYYHAERVNYAVAGTPNRLEYDQGFFVKGGDGLADVKPIAHLYKTQVYALARHLGVPEAITSRPPTTDTYSMPQTQEEFYFCLPYDQLDLLLWAYNHGVSCKEAGGTLAIPRIRCGGCTRTSRPNATWPTTSARRRCWSSRWRAERGIASCYDPRREGGGYHV